MDNCVPYCLPGNCCQALASGLLFILSFLCDPQLCASAARIRVDLFPRCRNRFLGYDTQRGLLGSTIADRFLRRALASAGLRLEKPFHLAVFTAMVRNDRDVSA